MQQADDEKERDGFRNEFKKDVKRHIDSIGRKYIRPEEGTVDFAIMYLPAESIYNEASENAEIAKYSRSRNVQLVSPNSLFYFLRVVLIAYQSEKFEENAKKVLSLIAGVKQEATKFGEGLELTAKHLSNAKKNMDDTVSGYQKLELKIDRVGEYSDAIPLLKEKEKRAKKSASEIEDEEKLPLE
jgi:DNA recombination protein RmuC